MFTRKDRNNILLSLTEHGLRLARVLQLEDRAVTVDQFVELPAGDEEAMRKWLDLVFPDRGTGFLSAYVTFYPADRLISREVINPRRLDEPNYLPSLVTESAKILSPREWQIGLIHPGDGSELNSESMQRTGLIVGASWNSIRETQELLRHWNFRPRQLELGSVTMLGGLSRHLGLSGYSDAVAACEIGSTQTRLYLLGKDGVHTPPALPYGLLSIEEAVMKELGLPDVQSARVQLESPIDALQTHSRRLVRLISRHLRPAIDYFEMQTGQRIGSLFSAYLPSRLSWLEQALCSAVDLDPFPVKMQHWMKATSVSLTGPEEPVPDHHWMPALGIIAQLNSVAPTQSGASAQLAVSATRSPYGPEA